MDTKDWIALSALILGIINLCWNVYVFRRVQSISRNLEEYKARVQLKVKRADLLRKAGIDVGSITIDRSIINHFEDPNTRGGLPENYETRIPDLYVSEKVREVLRKAGIQFTVFEQEQINRHISALKESERIPPIQDEDGWLAENFVQRIREYEEVQRSRLSALEEFLKDCADRVEASLRGVEDV